MTDHTALEIQRIAPRSSDLGEGLMVARTLPSRARRMVGAWCFLDHIGPTHFADGQGLHVGAHPHTRLQTFTWMIEGEILHRDSLGNEQVIRPGQVNLMTAGHGISHTEDSAQPGQRLHAAQLWIALPDAVAECPPDFAHYPDLPQWNDAQASAVRCALMAGQYAGHTAPTAVHSPLLGLELHNTGSTPVTVALALAPGFEHGLMALEGGFHLAGQDFAMDELAYVASGPAQAGLLLAPGARVLLLGGTPLGEAVTMWWNFVGPDLASIRGYRAEWEAASPRFGSVHGGEGRRIAAPALP